MTMDKSSEGKTQSTRRKGSKDVIWMWHVLMCGCVHVRECITEDQL